LCSKSTGGDGGRGIPSLSIGFEETANIFYSLASKDQVADFPKTKLIEAKNTDCFVNIRASVNKKSLSNIDPGVISARSKVLRPRSEEIVNNTRWILCNYPTNSLAQEADMSLDEYEDFLYNATNIDWNKVKQKEMKLKKALDKANTVHIVGKDTDLKLSIKGERPSHATAIGTCPTEWCSFSRGGLRRRPHLLRDARDIPWPGGPRHKA
jgi:aminopeptidase